MRLQKFNSLLCISETTCLFLQNHKIVYISKEGLDLKNLSFAGASPWSEGLKAPQYVVLKDKEIMNWLEVCLSGFEVQ